MDPATTPVAADNTGTEQSTPPSEETSAPLTLMQRLRAKYGDNPTSEEPAAEAATDTPPATPPDAQEKPKEEPPKEGEPAAEPPKEEPKPADRLELQNARLTKDLTKAKSEGLEFKKRADTAESELTGLRERGKKDPIALAAELAGMDWKDLLGRYAKGEYDQRSPTMSPEIQELRDYVKQQKAREAEQAKLAKRQADFAADLPKVKQLLEVSAAEFPIFAAMPDAAEELLNELYDEEERTGKKADASVLRDRLAELEETGKKTFGEYLSNKKLLAHVASTNPAARAAMSEALGLTTQNTAGPASSPQGTPTTPRPDASPPRTVATQTEVPTRTDREPTEDELRAESISLLRKGREAGLFRTW